MNERSECRQSLNIKNKLLLVLLVGMFLFNCANVSAIWETKSFDKDVGKYGEIKINDYLFLNKIDYRLTDYDNSVINAWAEGEYTAYKKTHLFTGIFYKDILGNKGNLKNVNFYIWNNETEIRYNPIYKNQNCYNDTNYTEDEVSYGMIINGTIEKCDRVLISNESYEVDISGWVSYEKGMKIDKGEGRWRLTAEKPKNVKVDFVLEGHNKEFTEWAWFNNSWGYKRELGNLIGNFSYMNITYDAHMQTDFDDLRFVNTAGTIEYNYTISDKNDSNWVIVRVHNQGDTTIDMYYGNADVSTTSSASDTYFEPVSYWYLDELSGTVADVIGTNNGTNNGATTGVVGKINNSYDFEATENDYVSTPIDLTDYTNFSVSFWCKPESFTSRGQIVSQDISGNRVLYVEVAASSGNTIVSLGGVGLTATTLQVGVWTHFVITREGTTGKVYIDGNNTDTDTVSVPASSSITFRMGNRIYGGFNDPFDGLIDEVTIHNKALTLDQIQQLYSQNEPSYTLGAEESSNAAPTITANVTKSDIVNQNTDYLVNLTIEDTDVGDTLTGYVQFYVNGTSTSTEQSAIAVNGTTTLIGTLSYGNFSGGDNLTAQVWAGDGTVNTTKVYLISSIVTSPPSVTNLIEFPTDPATFSQSTMYQFNSTITDNGVLDDIILEFNGTNYTATNISADIFNVSFANLSVGIYNYRWFANDTEGIINNTVTGSYTINQATSEGTLTSNIGWTINETQEVTIGLSESNGGDDDLTYIVSRDNIAKGTGETWTPAYGTYSYVLNTTGGVNWTENISMDTQTLTVNDNINPDIVIDFPVDGSSYSSIITELNYTATDTNLNSCWYSLNGGLANTTITCGNDVTGLNSGEGSSTWQIWANDSDNNINTTTTTFHVDTISPSVTNLIEFPTDPATYSLGTVYHFNATVTDTNTLDDIIFEFDGVNHTATNISADIFNVSFTDLQAGVYNYRWFANDTAGNLNNTATGSYTINKATSQTSLTFDIDSPQTYGTAITPTCSVTAGDGPAVLTYDGNTITSGVAITLGADTYSFNCSYAENANYTGSQNVSSYTIDKGMPTASLTSTLGWYMDRGKEVTIGSSNPQSNDGDVLYEVFRDSVSKGTGETWTPAAGTYTYFLNTSGGANWTANVSMHTVDLVVDPSSPNITSLTEYPSDPATFSQSTVYQFNATILDANTLDDIIFEFNGTNYTASNTSADIFYIDLNNLTAGTYNYRWFANDTLGNFNNSVTGIYMVNKAVPPLTLSATTPITYGTITDFSGSGCPAQLSCSLDITNNVYAAGTITGNYSTAGNINYTSAYANFTVTINKVSLVGSITGVSVINYTNMANVTANETNNNDSDVVYILYRNNVTVSNPDNTILGVGNYFYHYNSTGGQNYTANNDITNFTLTIDKATAEVYAYVGNLRANYLGNNLTAINEYLNGSLNIGLGNIKMYLNNSLIASGSPPLYNITDFPLGSYYFNVTYDGNDNYTSDEEHWSINITVWFLANLTGVFNLNADTGTTAYDISGNINNGTIEGASWEGDSITITLLDSIDYSINKDTGLFVLLNDARDKTLLAISYTYYEYDDDFLGGIIIKILPGLLIMLVLIMIFRLFINRGNDEVEEHLYEY